MTSYYPGTAVPFDTFPSLAAIRDPMLDGPGHPVVADAAYRFRVVGNLMLGASSTVRDAAIRLRAGYEGVAAEAVQVHLGRMAAIGEVGEAQSQLTHRALADQAEQVARVRREIAALPDSSIFRYDPTVPVGLAGEQQEAVALATTFQANTNHNLENVFAPFEPAAAPAIGPAGADPGGGAGAGVGGFGGGAASTAPAGALPPSPAGGSGPAGAGAALPPVAALPPAATAPPVPPGGAPIPERPVPPGGALPPGGSLVPGGGAGRPGTVPPYGRAGAPVPGPSRVPGGVARPTGGWQPGQPWTGRSAPPGSGGSAGGTGVRPGAPGTGGGVRGPLADPARGAPQTTATSPARPTGPGGFPMGGGAAAGGRDDEHARPPWLLQDDPDSIWFAGMPHYVDPVIR
ncbi:MAG: hypothetical protein ACT4RN_22550 [Pseudonocardia sp.]